MIPGVFPEALSNKVVGRKEKEMGGRDTTGNWGGGQSGKKGEQRTKRRERQWKPWSQNKSVLCKKRERTVGHRKHCDEVWSVQLSKEKGESLTEVTVTFSYSGVRS